MAVHALRIARVDRLDDPRLEAYRDIGDGALRARSSAFAVESREVVRRLLHDRRFHLRSVLLTEPVLALLSDLLEETTDVFVAANDLIRDVIGFNFHRGCMAIADRGRPLSLADVLAMPALRTIVVCEQMSNGDNVGGIFRNAMAFGAGAVVLSPGCADPLYRKVVRVSMGGSVSVPFVEVAEWPDALDRLREAGFTVVALTTRDGADVGTLGRMPKLALLLGSEGRGLTDAALHRADRCATIPMAPGIDSLNVAVACGVAMHRLVTAV